MTSDRCSSSARPTSFAPTSAACSSVRYGSLAIDPHLEAGGAPRHRLADLAEADDAQRLAAQLAPVKRARSHSPAPTEASAAGNVAQQGQHERHRVLRGRDGVAGRRVDDHHAGARRRLDVDAVGPDAGHADDAQARGAGRQQLGVDARLRAHDERVPAASRPEQGEQVGSSQPEADRRSRGPRRGARARAGPPARRRGCGPSVAGVYRSALSASPKTRRPRARIASRSGWRM